MAGFDLTLLRHSFIHLGVWRLHFLGFVVSKTPGVSRVIARPLYDPTEGFIRNGHCHRPFYFWFRRVGLYTKSPSLFRRCRRLIIPSALWPDGRFHTKRPLPSSVLLLVPASGALCEVAFTIPSIPTHFHPVRSMTRRKVSYETAIAIVRSTFGSGEWGFIRSRLHYPVDADAFSSRPLYGPTEGFI
jgi:hypothetical protein